MSTKPWNEDEARRMAEAKTPWGKIGAAFGITGETAHRRLDPEYRAQRQALNTAAARNYKRKRMENPPAEDAGRVLYVTPDTRSWQQRFMGDPGPGRSALDMREKQHGREPAPTAVGRS